MVSLSHKHLYLEPTTSVWMKIHPCRRQRQLTDSVSGGIRFVNIHTGSSLERGVKQQGVVEKAIFSAFGYYDIVFGINLQR